MNLTKKIWHDENSEPPKNYLWAKGGKLFKNIEGQWKEVSKKESEDEGSGSDSMSMYDAWMKTFKTLQTDNFPVTPKKFAKGLISGYAVWDQSAGSMFIPFINDNTSHIFVIPEDEEEDLKENILDIQDIPEDIYADGAENDYYGYFLYDLDDLTQLSDVRTPLTALIDSYGMATPYFYQSELSKLCTNVLKFNGKNYVWFQDWD